MTNFDGESIAGDGAAGRGRRRMLVGAATLGMAPLALLLPAQPALAHHGWPGFDTDRLIYIAGTVSSDGVWGNPHFLFDVTLDGNLPARTQKLAIPKELQDPKTAFGSMPPLRTEALPVRAPLPR